MYYLVDLGLLGEVLLFHDKLHVYTEGISSASIYNRVTDYCAEAVLA